MADQATRTESKLVAELNDLLQLDHDALRAYELAIEKLQSPTLRETLTQFRGDHERHVENLTALVRSHGGIPIELAHIPTGFFKLAVQRLGTMGGDREILLAFKANERQVRDKYRRAAARTDHPADVAETLRRNAADEEKHYAWALETLDTLGFGPETMVGKAEGAFERVHEAAADAVEGAERRIMERAESARRGAKELPERARSAASIRLERTAEAVDRSADRLEERGGMGARAGSMAHRLADTLEDGAVYLRSHDTAAMREDLSRQVDLHPIRSVLLVVGAGILVGRLLR